MTKKVTSGGRKKPCGKHVVFEATGEKPRMPVRQGGVSSVKRLLAFLQKDGYADRLASS